MPRGSTPASRGTAALLTRRREILAQGDYEAVSKNPDVVQAYMGAGHA